MNSNLSGKSTLVGTQAPAFRLLNEKSEWVNSQTYIDAGPTMLVFYPGDFTPVCTKQLCSYRDAYERFNSYGIKIIGISSNPPESHQKFIEKYQFGFPLLSDPDKSIFKSYGVTSLFMFGGTSRAVFILGKGGMVLYRHVEATPLTHRKPGELLEIVDGLKAKKLI